MQAPASILLGSRMKLVWTVSWKTARLMLGPGDSPKERECVPEYADNEYSGEELGVLDLSFSIRTIFNSSDSQLSRWTQSIFRTSRKTRC